MTLQGKIAVITGASSGIGMAVAKNLNEAGVGLVLTARREERLRELAATCKRAVVVSGDIADPKLPQHLVDEAVRQFGQCDIVFNNAGVIEAGTVEKIDIERVCRMVRVNVEAAFRMAYTAVKHFAKVGHGHLVNTSSVLGMKIRPTAGAYAGTKYAIEALSEALRIELANTKVKVSCIEPGLVLTGLHDEWPVHPKEAMGISRPLVPEDVANCVRFILEQPDHIQIPRLMVVPKEQKL